MKISLSLSLLLAVSNSLLAWSFAPRVSMPARVRGDATTRLFQAAAAPDDEKTLRNAIASRNEKVDNEGQYAVVDGENLYKGIVFDESQQGGPQAQVIAFVDDDPDARSSVDTNASQSAVSVLAQTMQRLVKPRAYPLFLAEKAAEIAEMTVSDILHPNKHSHAYHAHGGDKTATKERIVILGSGWGAASFLKAIDTSLYDVTVISPRVSSRNGAHRVICSSQWTSCSSRQSANYSCCISSPEPLCIHTHAGGCLCRNRRISQYL